MRDGNGRTPPPFPGLRAFRTDEHHLFFGREDQTAALLTLLRTHRFLAVVGTSGSGKSSLVRAGLIPALLRGGMSRAGSHWEIVVFRPGGEPLLNLARALVEADLYDGADAETLPRLLATLGRAGSGLVEAVRQSDAVTPETRLLVVVDQFEELFRFGVRDAGSGEEATSFVKLLLTACEQSEQVYVAITMRSDYLGDCSTFAGLAEAVNRSEYLIPRLSRDQRRDAIVHPVGVGGGTISPRLVQRMLNDVGDDPDQLPVLQHALLRTWNVWTARGDRTAPVEIEDFEATGGMAQALSRHADEVYAALPDDSHRTACARVFRALTEMGVDGRGIRRPTSVADLVAITGVDRATVAGVLEAFRAPGVTLVTPGPGTELGDRTIVDLSHESLMRCWERLRDWVDDEARSARVYRRVSDTAGLWSDGRAGLFQDPDLSIAVSWREKERPTAAWAQQYGGSFDLAMRFIDESLEKARAAERERESARQRELEQARRLAEEQRLRLEEQQRGARRLRRILAGLAAVALVAVGTSVVAAKFWRDASEARVQAEDNAESARESAALASRNESTAQSEARRANEQKSLAEASRATAESAERQARDAAAAGRRLLYATDMKLAPFVWADDRATARQFAERLEAHDPAKNGDAPGTEDLRGFEWHYFGHLLASASDTYPHEAGVLAAAVAADDRVVSLDRGLRLRRWSPETHRAEESPPASAESATRPEAAISGDGNLVAFADGPQVRLLDARTGAEIRRMDPEASRITDLALSADGRRLVTFANGSIGGYDAAASAPFASVLVEEAFRGESGVDVSADGTTLALGPFGPVGEFVAVFRLDSAGRRIERVGRVGERGSVGAFAISPDGSHVALGGRLGSSVAVFETATGKRIANDDTGHASTVSAVAFSRDGSRLATGAVDGCIRIWSTRGTLTPGRMLKGHSGPVEGLAFSADGRTLVSTSADGTVRRWDVTASAVRSIGSSLPSGTVGGQRPPMEPAYSPDGLLIAVADGPRVVLVDASSARPVRVLAGDAGDVLSVAFSPDGRLLAIGRRTGTGAPYPDRPSGVSLWEVDTGSRLAELGGIDSPGWQTEAYSDVDALAFTPDGRFLVAGFGGRGHRFFPAGGDEIHVWDVATGARFRPRSEPGEGCVAISFSRDGGRMATASHDGTARIWDVGTWSVLRTLTLPRGESMRDACFSPDGRSLATASIAGAIHLWDADTGALRTTLAGHSAAALRVAYSPDGRTLASGGSDATLRLWNLATSTQLMILEGEGIRLGRIIDSVAFAPDGTALAASGNLDAAVWSAAPSPWDDPTRGAAALGRLRNSNADFRSRIRMLSDQPRLHEALALLADRAGDDGVRAALAAARANWHAMHGEWAAAAAEFDRVGPDPGGWLRTPGLLRVATALVHQGRAETAASLLVGGAARRREDGLPAIADAAADPLVASLKRLADERLAARPRDAGLRELRAELAGQWSGAQAQVADCTAALDALPNAGTPDATAARTRLLLRRAAAHVAAQAWQPALDDLARSVEAASADEAVFALRARAHEGLGAWEAAAADWARAASRDLAGARSLADAARRACSAGRREAAVPAFDAAQRWYEAALEPESASATLAQELAALLVERIPEPTWTVLRPDSMTSAVGSTMTAQPDGSVLIAGPDSDREVLCITFAPHAGPIRAFRLEAMRHPFQVEFEIRSGQEPAELRTASATHPVRGVEPLPRPSTTVVRWNGHEFGGRTATAWCAAESDPSAADRLRLELRPGPASESFPRRFRLSVSDAPGIDGRERIRFAADRLKAPWAKLAAARLALGDEAAVDRIAARGPDPARQVGDLFSALGDWSRAIAYFDRSLAAAPGDGVALAARAEAHAAVGRAELAEADWLRAVADQPRLRREAFGALAAAGRASAAASVGRLLVDEDPRSVQSWLRAASAVALAGDRAAYVEFIERMEKQLRGGGPLQGYDDWVTANAVCRTGALIPGAFDPNRLPVEALSKPLDDGVLGDSAPSGWITRALLEVRRGDAASALRFVERAEELRRDIPPAHRSLLPAVRALVRQALGDDAAALADADEAERMAGNWLRRDMGGHWQDYGDGLTPLVLVREVRARASK